MKELINVTHYIIRRKGKKTYDHIKWCRKALDKIQHFHNKNTQHTEQDKTTSA